MVGGPRHRCGASTYGYDGFAMLLRVFNETVTLSAATQGGSRWGNGQYNVEAEVVRGRRQDKDQGRRQMEQTLISFASRWAS